MQSAGTLSSRRKSPSLLQESFFYSTVPSLFPSRWLSLNSQIADTKPSNSSTIIDLLVFSITIIFESTKGLNNRSAQRLPFRFLSLPWCSMLLCAVLYHIAQPPIGRHAQSLSPVLRNVFTQELLLFHLAGYGRSAERGGQVRIMIPDLHGKANKFRLTAKGRFSPRGGRAGPFRWRSGRRPPGGRRQLSSTACR